MIRLCVMGAAVLVAAWHLSTPLDAYLDPGAGSALLQGIIGALAVASGFIAYQWHRIRALFGGRREADDATTRPDRPAE